MSKAKGNPRLSTSTSSEVLHRRQEDPPPSVGISSNPVLMMDPLDVFVNPRPLLRRIQNRLYGASAQEPRSGRLSDMVEVRPDRWAPAVELEYKDGNLVISAELPGLTTEDVKVEVIDHTLVIQGERRPERCPEIRSRRTERRYGRFYRSIELPDDADTSNVHAQLANGMLRVVVPVSDMGRTVQRIPVRTNAAVREQPATRVVG